MSTVSNLNVYKNLLNSISIKAPGKWDKHVNLSFSQNNQNKDIPLADYDGLKYEYKGMDDCAPLLDFEGTVLPNRDKLNTEEYCFMPVGGGDNRAEYIYNFSVVGTPTINDSIAHNFTDSNYIDIDTNVCSLNRIYYVKFTTGDNVSRFQNILAPYPFFELYVEEGKLRSWVESEYHAIECGSVETNTTYYAKIVVTDDTITLSYSTDGQTYTGDVTDSISFTSCDSFHIGKGVYTVENRWFSGSIDLLGTYVTDSSQHVVYSMATTITVNNYTIKYPKYTNYIKIGSPTIDEETGIASGFSSSNYLRLIDHFNPGDSAWEVQTKVKTNSIDSERDIFGTTSDQNLFRIGLAGTVKDRWQILVANNSSWITTSSHYGSYNVLSNTVYWIKAGFDGVDTYYLDYSLDGQTYTRDVTYTSTSKMTPQPNIYTLIGQGQTWDGMVDLSETRILINNEIWWQAKEEYIKYLPGITNNYTDTGSEITLNCFALNNKSTILTQNSSYENSRLIGTVTIPSHLVYNYEIDGWWPINYNRIVGCNSSNVSAYSNDCGKTWNVTQMPEIGNWRKVAFGGGKYVAVSEEPGTTTGAYSIDGINWVQTTMPEIPADAGGYYDICYGDGKYVAILYSTNVFAISSDGIDWDPVTLTDTARWRNICYGNGIFLANGYSDRKFATSVDGINWTINSVTRSYSALTFGNGVFVTVSGKNLYYSPDGITWTACTQPNVPTTINLYNLTFGNGVFVCASLGDPTNGYYTLISTDGINWSQTSNTESYLAETSDTGYNLRCICPISNGFVGLSRNGEYTFRCKNDGNWLIIPNSTPLSIEGEWNSICCAKIEDLENYDDIQAGPAVVVPEITEDPDNNGDDDDNGGNDYFSPTDPIVN